MTDARVPGPDFVLATCPNGGGVFLLGSGAPLRVRQENATGVCLFDGQILWAVQDEGARRIRRLGSNGSTVVELSASRLDLHDVVSCGRDLYAVTTEDNAIRRLDGALREVSVSVLPGEIDSSHVNCVAEYQGRLVASAFARTSTHRGYKGQTQGNGYVFDVAINEVLIDGLSQPHSLLAADDQLFLCNSECGELRIYHGRELVTSLQLGGYTRGIAISAGKLYVGLSASRNAELASGVESACVVVLDRESLRELDRWRLPCAEVYGLLPLALDQLPLVVASVSEERQALRDELDRETAARQCIASELQQLSTTHEQLTASLAWREELRAQHESRVQLLQEELRHRTETLVAQQQAWEVARKAWEELHERIAGSMQQLQERLARAEQETDRLQQALRHEEAVRTSAVEARDELAERLRQVEEESRSSGEAHAAELDEVCNRQALEQEQSRRLREELKEREAAMAALAAEVSALRSSASWRITRPFRALAGAGSAILEGGWMRRLAGLPASAWHSLPHGTRSGLERRIFRASPRVAQWVSRYSAWRLSQRIPVLHAPPPREPVVGPPVAASYDPSIRLIAFYLPQFHAIPENDRWWGEGFTEWTNVRPATPQFPGHYQPHVPGALGYYDLLDPDVFRRQVALAREHGVGGFCFYFYWFGGTRLLEQPLLRYLEDPDLDLPFCLCWANENWSRRWDGLDQEILIDQKHSPEDDIAFIEHVARYLRDPRCIRAGGKPLLLVYRPGLLPDAAATARRWRQRCRDLGIGEIYLAYTQSFETVHPGEYGFDGAVEFPPNNSGPPVMTDTVVPEGSAFQGVVYDWTVFPERSRDYADPAYPLFRAVCPGWDNTARRGARATVFVGNTPGLYREWLQNAVRDTQLRHAPDSRLVFVNAWNEWAEGAHLEPDLRDGTAYLEATRDVLMPRPANGEAGSPIVLVSHDAHPHGAQWLAVHIGRALAREFRHSVEVVLLGDGTLTGEFEAIGNVHYAAGISGDDAELASLARRLAGKARVALVNTVVAGRFAATLKQAGFTVVCLVHEMPRLVRDYGLEDHARAIATHADRVVFAAEPVRAGFLRFGALPAARQVLRPQGLFTRSRYLGVEDLSLPRQRLRERLRLPVESRIVLAVGYGDRRKGLDLFAQAATTLCRGDSELHFVWVGHYEDALMRDALAAVEATAGPGRFHAVGMEFDTDDFYAGADVFVLPSREDPFPSVVLEALAVGLPVVAFAESGGAAEILSRGCGVLVPEVGADALSDAISGLLGDEGARRELGNSGRELVASEFSFRAYIFDLLALVGWKLPRVSVVVPNFNYAGLLAERLDSIARQTLVPYEVIVLDDASSDDSLARLSEYATRTGVELRVVRNRTNSGSVFRQWLRGAELARGDYIWIAEADDLCGERLAETVVAPLVADERVVLSYCQSAQVDGAGGPLASDYRYYTDEICAERWLSPYSCDGREEVCNALFMKNSIPNVSAVMFRRTALVAALCDHIEEIATYRVAGDWLTYALVLEKGRIAYSPQSLNVHRRHEQSVTSSSAKAGHLDEVEKVQRRIAELFALDPERGQRAARYAETLRRQFGLNDAVPPVTEQ